MGRIKNDWERSEIKEICKQPSSHCILAGFSLIPRLVLNQGFCRASKAAELSHALFYLQVKCFVCFLSTLSPCTGGFLHYFIPASACTAAVYFLLTLSMGRSNLVPRGFIPPCIRARQPRDSSLLSLSLFRSAETWKGTDQALPVITAPNLSSNSKSAGKFLQQNNITGLQDLVVKQTVLEADALIRRRSQISWTEGQRDWVPKGRTSKKIG